MFTRKELLKAIADCEAGADNYQSCEKLATLYTIYSHQYPQETAQSFEAKPVDVLETDNGSEFLIAINGKPVHEVLKIVDELMSTICVVNERLYNGVMSRVNKL